METRFCDQETVTVLLYLITLRLRKAHQHLSRLVLLFIQDENAIVQWWYGSARTLTCKSAQASLLP